MNELEELKAQRDAINKRIREIKYEALPRTERVRLLYNGNKVYERWSVSLGIDNAFNTTKRWSHIISKSSKEEALEEVLTVINDLKEFYEKAKGGKNNVQQEE